MLQIECSDVAKFYGKTEVFRNLNFRFEGARCIGIQGPNGSGKSTLLKCLSGLLRPSKGCITWRENGEKVDQRMIRFRMGFAAPYLNLYNELTVTENLSFLRRIRSSDLAGSRALKSEDSVSVNRAAANSGTSDSASDHFFQSDPIPEIPPAEQSQNHSGKFQSEVPDLSDLITMCGLTGLHNQSLGTLSSGQQQRVRLAGALAFAPPILMLDEPGSNLDDEGHALVADLVTRQKKAGGMIFLASNRKEELEICDDMVTLVPKEKTKPRY